MTKNDEIAKLKAEIKKRDRIIEVICEFISEKHDERPIDPLNDMCIKCSGSEINGIKCWKKYFPDQVEKEDG